MGAAILVVDDDTSIREMLVDILERRGYRVIAARDGMDALAAIERDAPALVLLDVLMPLLDGRVVAEQLIAGGMDVRLVLMSASHEAVRCVGIRADAYLTKPFELRTLLAIVDRLLGERPPAEPAVVA